MKLLERRYDASAPEVEIARDLAVRGLLVAPVLLGLSALVWGANGAWSALFAIGLVVGNFLLAAGMLSWAGKISVAFVMAAALFGYLLRLGIVTAAVLLVKDLSWVELVPLGLTIIVTHLGLLLWETKYVSASLAHPGLKPGAGIGAPKE